MPRRRSSRRLAFSSPNQALLTSAVLTALAMSASAQSQFEELPRKGLPIDTDDTNAVALGDVDGDGDLDLILGNGGFYVQQNRLCLNDGNGVFIDATAGQLPVGSDTTRSVALGDVDGDGDLDLVIGNGGQNRLLLNDGTGTFSDATASQMPVLIDNTSSVALGDVDGDGDLDMVIGNGRYSGQQNRLYLNNGTGTFTDATASGMPTDNEATRSVALGDVDGDGDLDIVIGNRPVGPSWSGGQNRLYLNNGTGTFSDATASQMPVDNDVCNSLALGDVDGDGDLDMVLRGAGQNRLYRNNGTGAFIDVTSAQLPAVFDLGSALVLGDVDGDGDLDVVSGGYSFSYTGWGYYARRTHLYVNDGSGTFVDAPTTRLDIVNATAAVALGDVDGDGDLDLVQGNRPSYYYQGSQNRLYLNLQRQLHADAAPLIGLPYSLDAYLRYGPSSAIDLAAIYLSTGSASVPLGALGTLGIDPAQIVPLPTLVIPQPAGVGSGAFVIPSQANLIGLEIYSQAVLVAYPDDLRLSNVLRDVVAMSMPATITSITPPSAAAGTPVTIAGTNFLSGVTLLVDGIATPVTANTGTSLTFVMPSGAGCDALVEVMSPIIPIVSQLMNVTPTVTSTSASIGPAVGGAPFTVNGQGLLGATVTFNGVPMTNITNQTQTVITGTTPPGTPGPAVVLVGNAIGCQQLVNYSYDATPTLTSIDPPVALAGTPVTINGNNFLSGVGLTVGGNATPITFLTDTTLTFQMPPGHGCDTPVTVTNVGGAPVSMLINATPVITFFPIASGPAAGNSLFVINGQNLSGTTVTFGGVPVTNLSLQSSTAIVGTTPPGAVGPVQVAVVNAIGCAGTTNFTYQ